MADGIAEATKGSSRNCLRLIGVTPWAGIVLRPHNPSERIAAVPRDCNQHESDRWERQVSGRCRPRDCPFLCSAERSQREIIRDDRHAFGMPFRRRELTRDLPFEQNEEISQVSAFTTEGRSNFKCRPLGRNRVRHQT
jgi:hypothetical protein